MTKHAARHASFGESFRVPTLTAILRFSTAIGPVNRGDVETAVPLLKEASDLAARAEQTPSLATRTAIPYLASALGAIADVAVLKLVREPTNPEIKRLRDTLTKWEKSSGLVEKEKGAKK